MRSKARICAARYAIHEVQRNASLSQDIPPPSPYLSPSPLRSVLTMQGSRAPTTSSAGSLL